MNQPPRLTVGIVAGEASGDILGAGLIKALRDKMPNIQFEGIAGPQMIDAGCKTLYPMERLSVMGLIEPIKHLPELIKIRKKLSQHFIKNPPDIFIGIDSPDFNLGLEVQLKKNNIPVVHYVSPSVWAWRQSRIKKIKKAVDLMLTLFPFEVDFYQRHHVLVKFVGHPLADQIPMNIDQKAVRQRLNLPLDAKILAILPGSRKVEVKYLAKDFIETAQWCLERDASIQVITAMISPERRQQFMRIIKTVAPQFPVTVFDGQSRDVMEAADVLLLASGTVTLEAMLLKKPMVVAYRLSSLTYFIAKRLVKLKYFSLPNLIMNQKIVPEFLQNEVNADNLGPELLRQLNNSTYRKKIVDQFNQIHQLLCCNANEKAASAVMEIIKKVHARYS